MQSLWPWDAITTGALTALHVVAVVLVILEERRKPSATVAWVLALVFMPIAGLLAYLLIGPRRRVKRARAQAEGIARSLAQVNRRDGQPPPRQPMPERALTVMKLAERLTGLPATNGNTLTLLQDGAAAYSAMNAAIDTAERELHALYYIVQPDREGAAFVQRLAAAAARGVQVRVMVDAVGSFALTEPFWAPLVAAGGEVETFGRPSMLARIRKADRFDFRNHRKLLVVDGQQAYFGGLNIGVEYLGEDPDIGPWRDTHARVEGPAVAALQAVFLGDWLTERPIDGELRRFFPAGGDTSIGNTCVQVIESGPSRRWSPVRHVLAQAMALAKERVWITSPYFVPDAVIEQALVSAALRGVDVRLLLPGKSDARVVRLASRSYYPELLDAGVRIYEHQVGFIHAKTLVIDDWLGAVGSANVDTRSLELNYELGGLIYDATVCAELVAAFEADLRNSQRIDQNQPRRWRAGQRLVQGVARLLSPLL